MESRAKRLIPYQRIRDEGLHFVEHETVGDGGLTYVRSTCTDAAGVVYDGVVYPNGTTSDEYYDKGEWPWEPMENIKPIPIMEGEGDAGACRMFDIVPAGDFFTRYGITRQQFADAIVATLEPLLGLKGYPSYYLYHYETEQEPSNEIRSDC
jgi:hypothetical protein